MYDVLLEINGVDAKEKPAKLKDALEGSDIVRLKLRRTPSTSELAAMSPKPAASGATGLLGGEWASFLATNLCCAAPRADAPRAGL